MDNGQLNDGNERPPPADLNQMCVSLAHPVPLGRRWISEHVRVAELGNAFALSLLCEDDSAESVCATRYLQIARELSRRVPNAMRVLASGEYMAQPTAILADEGELDETWTLLSSHFKCMIYAKVIPTIEFLSRVFAAVAGAHKAGIALRIVCPDLFWINSPKIYLRDLGCAIDVGRPQDGLNIRELEFFSPLPHFIAPEFRFDNPEAVDDWYRADVYALGVIAYEVITGHRPYSGGRNFIQWQQANVPLVPVRRLRPDFPASIERIIGSCLSLAPANRPADAIALVNEWDRACELLDATSRKRWSAWWGWLSGWATRRIRPSRGAPEARLPAEH